LSLRENLILTSKLYKSIFLNFRLSCTHFSSALSIEGNERSKRQAEEIYEWFPRPNNFGKYDESKLLNRQVIIVDPEIFEEEANNKGNLIKVTVSGQENIFIIGSQIKFTKN